MPDTTTPFDTYLRRWNAAPDGEPFATHSGELMPVRLDGHTNGRPAMLKIARSMEERIGGQVMRWWAGDGAAHVYACDEDAGVLLMERATGTQPYLIKSGGSIPVAGMLKTVLGIDTIFMGFGLDDDRVHSPNEKFELDCYRMGMKSHAMLIAELTGA